METSDHLALVPDGAGDQAPPATPVAGPQDGPATEASNLGARASEPSIVVDVTELSEDYQQRLGARLRAVRRARDLRLQDVEARSAGRFKAVVVGSYERGDRAISAHKLAALADFYDVPVGELLPDDGWSRTPPVGSGSLRLSLAALAEHPEDPQLAPVRRLAEHVRSLRGDHQGQVLTLRADDLRTTAIALGLSVDDLPAWLDAQGVLAHR